MNKKEILKKIVNARRSHVACVSSAAILVEGLNVIAEDAPVDEHHCPFGQWYYKQGEVLSSFPEYQAIAKPHSNLHRTYTEIYSIMSAVHAEEKDTRSFFQKMKGEKVQQKDKLQETQKARELLQKLQLYSNEVVAYLKNLEKRIISELKDSE